MNLYPYQIEGADFLAPRRAAILADEMGLGKTAQAIEVINIRKPDRVLIICPASLKVNWQRELDAWLRSFYVVGVAYGTTWPDADIVIINYDILKNFRKIIRSIPWGILIADECHYLKNIKAGRTKEVLGNKKTLPIPATQRLFLTGTPLVNRPYEMYPLLRSIAPNTFGDMWAFVHRYCGANKIFLGRSRHVWDFSGATNMHELNSKISGLMLRRLKKDVLKELPDKTYQVIEIPQPKDFNKFVPPYLGEDPLGEIAAIRHALGLIKVKAVVEHLLSVLETGQKVVCFAWHLDVIDQIAAAMENHTMVSCITGSTVNRQAQVDMFQNSEKSRVFIGNIRAAGVGITLTAASTVVFAEYPWTPADLSQAGDRCHRIGQKNAVLIQQIAIENSFDVYMANLLTRKQGVIDAVIDPKKTVEKYYGIKS